MGQQQSSQTAAPITTRIEEKEPKPIKLALVGAACVGKTTLMIQYDEKKFQTKYEPTIGVDFRGKAVFWGNGLLHRLQIWDMAGQEGFRRVTESYYPTNRVFLVIFALNDAKSFAETERYIRYIKENAKESNIICCLVGNKKDLPRAVTSTQINELLKKHPKMLYYESDAKNHEEVRIIFEDLIHLAVTGETLSVKNMKEARLNAARKQMLQQKSYADVQIISEARTSR